MKKQKNKKKKRTIVHAGDIKCPNCGSDNTTVIDSEFVCYNCKSKNTGIIVFAIFAAIFCLFVGLTVFV